MVLGLYLLSLGQFLIIAGVTLPLPLPYFLTPLVNPLFLFLRGSGRFSIFVILFLSLAVGYWVARFQFSIKLRPLRLTVFLFLTIFLSSENIIFPAPLYRYSENQFYKDLSGDKRDLVILDAPVFPQGGPSNKAYLLSQTIHGKKIIGGQLIGPSQPRSPEFDPGYRYRWLRCDGFNRFPGMPEELPSQLKVDKVDYLIVHKDLYCQVSKEALVYLEDNFEKIYSDDALIVFGTPAKP